MQEMDNALAQSSEDNKTLAGLVSNRLCKIPLYHLSANMRRNTYVINNCINSLHSGLAIKELCMARDGGKLVNSILF